MRDLQSRRLRLSIAIFVSATIATCSAALAMPADANRNGQVDTSDVDPFVLSLIDPAAYASAYCAGSITQVDLNSSGTVEGGDIQLFVNILINPPPVEIVLRDSIGPDTSWTDYQSGCPSAISVPGADWFLSPAVVVAPQRLILQRIVVVGFPSPNCFPSCSVDMTQWHYAVRVWSNVQALIGPPFPGVHQGDIADIFFLEPTVGPFPFGDGPNGQTPPVPDTYRFEFSMTSHGIVLEQGQSCIIGIESVSAINVDGLLVICGSNEPGNPIDYTYSNLLSPPNYSLPATQCTTPAPSGRHAIVVTGIPAP